MLPSSVLGYDGVNDHRRDFRGKYQIRRGMIVFVGQNVHPPQLRI